MFNFNIVSSWLHGLLTGFMPEWGAILTESILVALAIITLYAVFAIVLIYMERKICAFFQCRLGPMRVGPWGSLQVFSDVFKMLTKEIINMRQTDLFLHNLAPFLVVTASMVTFACLPWNKGAQIIDFNVGVFFFLAIGSLGVVGIGLGHGQADIGPFHSTSLLLSSSFRQRRREKFCHLYSTRFCARMQAPWQNRRRWYNVCTD